MFPFPSPLLLASGATGGGGGGSPIAFVGSGTVQVGGSSGVTFNFSSLLDELGGVPTVLTNDIVVVVRANASNSGTTNTALPTGYTQISDTSSGPNSFKSGYKFMGGTPDTSVTFPAPGGSIQRVAACIYVFRNVNQTTPVDVAATTASGASGAADPPSITPVTSGSLILACAGSAVGGGSTNASTFTNPSGYSATTNHFRTVLGNGTVDAAVGVGLKFGWTSGAEDPGTMGGSVAWVAHTLALRQA